MKTIPTILIMLTVALSGVAQAGNAKDRLAAKMRNERDDLAEQVAQGWLAEKQTSELRKKVVDLVDVHVRMTAMRIGDSANDIGGVLTDLKDIDMLSTDEMIDEIARAYFARKEGLRVNTRECFGGIYLLYPNR